MTPVAHYQRPDGTLRPLYSWEMVIAISNRDDLRDRLRVDFDAWLRAGGPFA